MSQRENIIIIVSAVVTLISILYGNRRTADVWRKRAQPFSTKILCSKDHWSARRTLGIQALHYEAFSLKPLISSYRHTCSCPGLFLPPPPMLHRLHNFIVPTSSSSSWLSPSDHVAFARHSSSSQDHVVANAAPAALSVLVAWIWWFVVGRRRRETGCVSASGSGAVFLNMKEYPTYPESRLMLMPSMWSTVITNPVFSTGACGSRCPSRCRSSSQHRPPIT